MIDKTDPTNRDTVPAMLTPGEFVLNKEASTMFAPVIEQMNDAGLQHRAMKNMGGGIPTYNTGGLVSQIREHEGFKDYVYDDGKGNPTIGTGHLLPDSYKKYIGKNHKPFSKEELEQMFLADVESAKINASKNFDNWNDLSENVKDGLVNMAFQLGQGGQSKFVKMRKAVEAGDYSEAAAQALDSDWNTQTPTRSTYLANVFLSETPQATIQTSSVAPMTSMPPSMRPNTQVDPIAIEQAIMQASVPQVQAAPPAPTDFGEAFKDARADMGAGGIFNFRGRDYNTNYLEEEDMVTANMGGAIHLQDGGWTSGLLDWFTEPKNGFTGGPPSVILGPTQQQLANQSAEERKSISQAALNPYGDVPAYEGELGTGQQDVIKPSVKDHPRYGEFERNMEASQGTRFLSDPVMAAAIFKNYLELNPLPDVNSDESLLQGSSDSVDTASKLSQEQLANQARDRRMSAVNEVHVPPLNAPPVTQPTQQQLANEAAAKRKVVSQAAINPLADVPAYEGELGTGDQYGPPPPTFTGDVVPYVGGLAGSLANRVGTEVSNAFSSVPTSPRDYNDIAGATGIDVPPKPSNATFEGKSLEELYNMFAVNGGQGTRSDPVLGQALMAEIEAREAAGEVHNVYDTSLHNAAALYRSRTSWPREQIAADISSQNAEKSAAILAVQQAELQAKLDAGTATQLDVDSFERKRKQNETVQKTATRDQETVRLTSEQQAALLAPATDIEAANAKALEAQRTAESERLQSYDPVTGTYSKPKKPENNITGVEAKVDEVQNTTAPTTTVQDGAAKAEAARIAETNKKKKDPEVSGAMDTIKSVFGDLFDSKELIRAAIMYLGGRATGMDGQQALAFAGKNYIAREEAKGIRTQKFIDKLVSDGKHEMGSIAAYKKSLDPNDLKLIGLTFTETGNTGTYYASNAAGNFVRLQLKEMKGSDDGIYLQDSKGNRYDPAELHQDPKRVKGTPEFDTALASQISLYKDTFDELRLQGGIVTNKMEGKPAVYKTDLKPSVVAADTAAWALRYGVPLQMVPGLMTEAYNLAIGGKDINGNPTRAQKIEPYLNQLWITQSAGDPNNFKIGKDDKAKFVETSTVSSWVSNIHNQMKKVNPQFNEVTPIRFSTWLRQTDISGKWSLPEEQGGLSQEARNAITKRGNAVGKSGYMQYILEEAAKNYEKTLTKPTT